MIHGNHLAVVGRPDVSAHPKQAAHGSINAHQETAARATGVSATHTVGSGAVIALVPALGGGGQTLG